MRVAARQVTAALAGLPGSARGLASPLLLAATAVITAVSLLAIPGQWLPVGSSTSAVVLIIGMAVTAAPAGHGHALLVTVPLAGLVSIGLNLLSMDYHVFILSRIRELRQRGAAAPDALAALATRAGATRLM